MYLNNSNYAVGNVKIRLIVRLYLSEMCKLQSESVMVPFRHSTCVYLMIYDSLSWCLTNSGFLDLSMIMLQLGKQLSDRINKWTVKFIHTRRRKTKFPTIYPTKYLPNDKFEYSYPLILTFWWIAAVNCLIILNCISVYIDDHYPLLSYEMTTAYRALYVCKLLHNLTIVHVRLNKENNIIFLLLKLYYKCKAYKCFNRKTKQAKTGFTLLENGQQRHAFISWK